MKMPNLGWNKIVSGSRSVWNATTSVGSSAGSLVKSKRGLMAAATLGVGTLASSAGYFVWQGRGGDATVEVAQGEGNAGDANGASGDDRTPHPIVDGLVADGNGAETANTDEGGGFGGARVQPLRPPPANAFRSNFQSQAGDEGAGANEAALGGPVEDGAPVEGGAEGQVGEEAPPAPPSGLRARMAATDDAAIRPVAGDGTPGESGAGLSQDGTVQDAAGQEPGLAADPGAAMPMEAVADGTSPAGDAAASLAPENAGAAGQEPAPLQAVPKVGDTSEQPGAGAAEPAAPAEPPPPPDRIAIPTEPAEPARPDAGAGRFSSGTSPGALPPRPTSRFSPGAPSLAPVAEGAADAALGAAGLAAGAAAGAAGSAGGALGGSAAGSFGGAAAGAAAGALGAAGLSSLSDQGPTISRPVPGPKELEGTQTPSLALEKIAPPEIQVGKPAVFQVKVKNVGRVTAHGVVVADHVPVGTKLLDADPEFVRGDDGIIRWQLGALAPGQEAVLAMKLLPEQEGEIGSVAQVSFQSQASVRTVCTRPQITLQHQTQQKALVGDDVILAITIANNGTGAATNLVIEENVPEGLAHPVDKELEYQIGTLRPGESKRLELTLKAAKAGQVENVIVARSDDTVVAEDRLQMEVVAPKLKVGLVGPKVRYLDRQAVYSVSVSNPGTAAGKNVELAAYLPRGLKFVAAENQGQYDSKLHAVFWGLAELPIGATGAAQLTVLPIEPGQQAIRVTGVGDLGVQDEFQQAVVVETQSELQFSVADVADPIEVGTDTTYDVRITNRGTRAATNVQLVIDFPGELQPIGGDGPSRVTARGQQIIVEPLGRLAPDTEARYKVQARGLRAGDPRIRVQLTSAESPTPVTKEESTRVYADE